jgi:hypothetical protein
MRALVLGVLACLTIGPAIAEGSTAITTVHLATATEFAAKCRTDRNWCIDAIKSMDNIRHPGTPATICVPAGISYEDRVPVLLRALDAHPDVYPYKAVETLWPCGGTTSSN